MNLWGPPVSSFFRGWRRAVIGRTWPAHRPHSQLDHVLVTPAGRVVDARVADARRLRPPAGGGHPGPGLTPRTPGLATGGRTGGSVVAMTDPLADFEPVRPSPPRATTRTVYRTGSGPAVIVISEIPGITPNVAGFARMVAGHRAAPR